MLKKVFSVISLIAIFTSLIVSTSPSKNVSAIYEEPFEIISMRSQYEKHFCNSDGTKTAFVYTTPIHYNVNGEWIDIDNTLIKNENGDYTNAKNSMSITLSSSSYAKGLNTIDDTPLASLTYGKHNISWDIIAPNNDTLTSISSKTNTNTKQSSIKIAEKNYEANLEVEDMNVEKITNTTIDKKYSTVQYESMLNSCDIEIDIKPISVEENITLTDKNTLPDELTFFIKSNGLNADLCNDNTIYFFDETGNSIFYISTPFMYETENKTIQSHDINVSLEKFKDGYMLSYILNEDWLISEERSFPVSVNQEITVVDNIFTTTISEAYPNSYINDDVFKIGGSAIAGNRFGALMSIPSSFVFSSDYVTITDAKLHIYFNGHDDSGNAGYLDLYVLLNQYMPYWGGVNFETAVRTLRFDVNTNSYNNLDITNVVSSWQNYYRSNSKVGVYPYGLAIKQTSNTCAVYEANATTDINPLYYTITYETDTNYTLTYAPNKYNDVTPYPSIYNFSKKMNCYAYALQIYDQGYVNGNSTHKLIPGELSLSSYSQFSTLTQLQNYYSSIPNSTELIQFVEQQMMRDSQIMGTNLQKITLSNENQFILPTGYNENSQRIIAMHTGTRTSGALDFHFYLRHGNGTCTQHGGTCSIWSHKRGDQSISNAINFTPLCDNNIASLAYNSSYSDTTYDTRLRFYTIQQDTNVYNSWYVYNSNTDKTAYIY